MGKSLGLAAYLAISARAGGWAGRKLDGRLASGKEDPDRICERKGEATRPRPDGPLIWFHAASVGEALSVQELIRCLCEERDDIHVLLTTGTRTSAELVTPRLPDRATHQFVPVDTRDAVVGFLDHWRPDLAVWVESELWPRLIHETHAREIPMVLLNARMSSRSYGRWRWARGIAGSLLRRFDKILAQEQTTADYLSNLGAPKDRLAVIGTLKEGAQVLPFSESDRREMIGHIGTRPLWLAASTHPGEEEIVAAAHRTVSVSAHRLLLILVPRHPERGPEIAEALRTQGWDVVLRSSGELPESDTQIYIADTLGELGLWYRLAPTSFIGGSLTQIGGHNPYEPAALGSAILYGPHVTNFAEIYDRLSKAGAALRVEDEASLAAAVEDLLAPDKAAKMAHEAWEISSLGAAVTNRALTEILDLLDARETP